MSASKSVNLLPFAVKRIGPDANVSIGRNRSACTSNALACMIGDPKRGPVKSGAQTGQWQRGLVKSCASITFPTLRRLRAMLPLIYRQNSFELSHQFCRLLHHDFSGSRFMPILPLEGTSTSSDAMPSAEYQDQSVLSRAHFVTIIARRELAATTSAVSAPM